MRVLDFRFLTMQATELKLAAPALEHSSLRFLQKKQRNFVTTRTFVSHCCIKI